jgi:hypothetical protein
VLSKCTTRHPRHEKGGGTIAQRGGHYRVVLRVSRNVRPMVFRTVRSLLLEAGAAIRPDDVIGSPQQRMYRQEATTSEACLLLAV